MINDREPKLHSPTTNQLINEAIKQSEKLPKEERREFLRKGIAISVGAAMVMSAGETLKGEEFKPNPKNLPPNVAEWGKSWGRDVNIYPYGLPSKYEANVGGGKTLPWVTGDQKRLSR